jgi:hypothetical protein
MSVTQQLLAEKELAFRMRLDRSFPDLLGNNPVEFYVSKLEARDPYYQYEAFPPAVLRRMARIQTRYGQEAVALYHKMGLCRLMIGALTRVSGHYIPNKIQEIYRSWFSRIVEDFDTQPDTYYDFDRPLWPLRKDIGVCCGRAIPVGGAWVVEKRLIARQSMIRQADKEPEKSDRQPGKFGALRKNSSRVMRKFRLDDLVRSARRIRLRLRAPLDKCFVIHTVERNIRDLGPEQMECAYRNIASLLLTNQNVWGVYRLSWFLDPVVGEISPDIGFLMNVPVSKGAELYKAGSCSADDTQKATMFSPVRSRLFKEGKYRPKSYFYFWPRTAVIEAFDSE